MAERNGYTADGNGKPTGGTVGQFTVPVRGSDGANDRPNIGGIPVESGTAEQYTGGRNLDGSPRRKPGRRAGAAEPAPKKDRAGLPSLDVTAGALKGLHDLTAMLTRIEELELDDSEAEKLAVSLIALGKYYPNVDVPGKYMAWMNLLTTMGTVYSPKVATYRIRKKNERRAAKPVQAMPGHPISQAN